MHDKEALKNYVARIKPTLAGQFFYYCIPYRKKVVLENIQRVFADSLSRKQIIHLAKCFYSHLATSLQENFRLTLHSEEKLSDLLEVRGHEAVIDIAEKHGGVILLTGHFGNWEFAPLITIHKFKQFQGQFHIIRRRLKHKWLEKILFKRYRNSGINVIPKDQALNPICKALEENGAVVFVLDQNAATHNKDGILAEFFGKKVGTYRSLAMIARYTGVPVVPMSSYRQADGSHVFEFHPQLEWIAAEKSSQELYLNTLNYNRCLERILWAHPEQWLWTHKRWKDHNG